jgi:hypothetical protein
MAADALPSAGRNRDVRGVITKMIRAMLIVFIFLAAPAFADSILVSPGGVSYHLDRGRYNERNAGIILGYEKDESTAVIAGRYKNSLGKDSTFAAVRYTPLKIGPVRIGAVAGIADGYAPRGGGFIPVIVPSAVLTIGYVDLTMAAWPSIFGSGAGAALTAAIRIGI